MCGKLRLWHQTFRSRCHPSFSARCSPLPARLAAPPCTPTARANPREGLQSPQPLSLSWGPPALSDLPQLPPYLPQATDPTALPKGSSGIWILALEGSRAGLGVGVVHGAAFFAPGPPAAASSTGPLGSAICSVMSPQDPSCLEPLAPGTKAISGEPQGQEKGSEKREGVLPGAWPGPEAPARQQLVSQGGQAGSVGAWMAAARAY